MHPQNQRTQTSEIHQAELLRHWQGFKKGLLLFVVSVVFIYAGYKWQPLLQVPGLILLILALFFSAKGYLGILKLRLRKSFSIRKG